MSTACVPRVLGARTRTHLCGFCGDRFPCATCRIGDRLGTGAYGEVYAATIRGAPLAIKVMPVVPSIQEFPIVHHTALLELQACAARGLLAPIQAWIHPSTHTLLVSMPRAVCDVRALSTLTRVPMSVVACVARAVTQCLARMHSAGFMHRDVSAKNVLIMEDGRCIVCDKSLVRRLWGESVMRLTYTPQVTAWAYRAPELVANPNTPAYDERIDIWGLGCVLMEVLRRDLLFEFMPSQACAQLACAMVVTGADAWPTDSIPLHPSSHTQVLRLARDARKRGTVLPVAASLQRQYKHLYKQRASEQIASAISFCEQCLRLDPRHRARAAELLHHPFLQYASEASMAKAITRLTVTPHVQFTSSGQRVPCSPPVPFGSPHVRGSRASPADAATPVRSRQCLRRDAVEVPLTPLPPLPSTALRLLGAMSNVRVAMADMAARLLWPSSRLKFYERPAAWVSFARAMCLFDDVLTRMDDATRRMRKEGAFGATARSYMLACIALAAQQEARTYAIRSKMTGHERHVATPALQRAVTNILIALHGMQWRPTVVELALSASRDRDACILAAAHASTSPQLSMAARGDTATLLAQHLRHKQRVLDAFRTITGVDACTGKPVQRAAAAAASASAVMRTVCLPDR